LTEHIKSLKQDNRNALASLYEFKMKYGIAFYDKWRYSVKLDTIQVEYNELSSNYRKLKEHIKTLEQENSTTRDRLHRYERESFDISFDIVLHVIALEDLQAAYNELNFHCTASNATQYEWITGLIHAFAVLSTEYHTHELNYTKQIDSLVHANTNLIAQITEYHTHELNYTKQIDSLMNENTNLIEQITKLASIYRQCAASLDTYEQRARQLTIAEQSSRIDFSVRHSPCQYDMCIL
jgi:chromosome segregation ATPase